MKYDASWYTEEPPYRFKEFQNFITDQFKKGNIKELQGCKWCKSSGLDVKRLTMASELDRYCRVCNGTGVVKFELKSTNGLYSCVVCNGYGYTNGHKCSSCIGTGFVDWIDRVVGIEK